MEKKHQRTRSYCLPEAIISRIEWGKIEVNGVTYKDLKIWHSTGERFGVKEWDWSETGTRHDPGIQIADLQDFIDLVDIVILSRGMKLRLQIPTETIEYVTRQGKALIWLESTEAVEKYNEYVQLGFNVGALIHSTC